MIEYVGGMRIVAAVSLLLAGCSTIFGLDRPVLVDGVSEGGPDDAGDDATASDDAPDSGQSANGCPASYSLTYATSRYRRIVAMMPWPDAAQDCADDMTTGAKHTHLAVMGTETERSALAGMGAGSTWIGLTDRVVEGTYRWVTAEATSGYPPASGTPWGPGEPDNVVGEDCIAVTIGGLFQDASCGGGLQALCECDDHANDPTQYTP